MNELREKIRLLAEQYNDTTAAALATHADAIAEIFRLSEIFRLPGDDVVYRFTIELEDVHQDLDWDPQDGWDSPSTVADTLTKLWLQERRRAARIREACAQIADAEHDACEALAAKFKRTTRTLNEERALVAARIADTIRGQDNRLDKDALAEDKPDPVPESPPPALAICQCGHQRRFHNPDGSCSSCWPCKAFRRGWQALPVMTADRGARGGADGDLRGRAIAAIAKVTDYADVNVHEVYAWIGNLAQAAHRGDADVVAQLCREKSRVPGEF